MNKISGELKVNEIESFDAMLVSLAGKRNASNTFSYHKDPADCGHGGEDVVTRHNWFPENTKNFLYNFWLVKLISLLDEFIS